ncbi:TnsA endonuclease N-terminal domain-containing protein [Paenibacillus filicis]|uniref:TnsA endonuclease N-terminal domain-containing protein n=1 Tax=Paenibacillus gyeongsangnamensis TaxID=3388067 RepID=A0ABT4Q949_9BACL|nr:TnsA endonuclease N-terminal domain-containing protein [Paenibacillus filicis]MCZ8513399.1 TnsA endonuclease N-terminal domain-containing protein [Paenibacillus filicis]
MPYKPAREIKPKRKGYRGKEPFLKTGDMIHWESFLERNFIRLADFDIRVVEIFYQPECIDYLVNGKKHKYYPDFKLILEDNRVFIIEVKALRFKNSPKNVIKYEAGRKFCEARGWHYEIFTENEINTKYLQANLSLLRHLGTQVVSDEIMDQIMQQLELKTEMFLYELRESCEEIDEENFYRAVYQLIYLQEISTELVNVKLSDDSILRVSAGEERS